MNKTVIISDLHLTKDTQLFEYFCQNIANNYQNLFILGDLFDLYLGDDLIDSHYSKIVATIKSINKETKVFIMTGNRDFLISQQFAKKTNSTIITEPFIFENFVLIHGDTLVTDDKKYQIFKKFIQHKITKSIFLLLPKSIRKKLANKIQQATKASKHKKSAYIMDINEQSLTKFMQKYPKFDLIHGHTHKQNIHKYSSYNRYVLPDWNKNKGGAIEIIEGEINYLQF